ncbi:stress response translation initiation inhibitor YciH [Bermanella sp. R86510]|uniref:stress response translation initiation inhibitor YciH n=1 Tax=unclassified Bermanella TaxID=2627862 RepID=UPI0037CC500E
MALVYSTETGQLCPQCEQPKEQCICKDGAAPESDGILRVKREKKGRGGKVVTTISGYDGDKKAYSDLLKKMKKRFGCGGAVKNWVIELQGDLTDQSVDFLRNLGHEVKKSGG